MGTDINLYIVRPATRGSASHHALFTATHAHDYVADTTFKEQLAFVACLVNCLVAGCEIESGMG